MLLTVVLLITFRDLFITLIRMFDHYKRVLFIRASCLRMNVFMHNDY